MTKQERVTFVINTLKELYPYDSDSVRSQGSLYLVDCGFAFGAVH